jgi:hypothetical protein
MGGKRLFHFPAAQWIYCQRGYLFLEACSIYNREGPETIGGVLNCSSASETGCLRTEQQTGIGVCPMETEKFMLTARTIPAIYRRTFLKDSQNARFNIHEKQLVVVADSRGGV